MNLSFPNQKTLRLSYNSYRLDSFLASSTAACNLLLVACIAEFEDELRGSTSTGCVTGIGVTVGGVTKSDVTKGVELCDGVTWVAGCSNGVVIILDVPAK